MALFTSSTTSPAGGSLWTRRGPEDPVGRFGSLLEWTSITLSTKSLDVRPLWPPLTLLQPA